MNKSRYDKLVEELNVYVQQYYSGNESEIEDPEFDSIYIEIQNIEKEHPDWIRKDSPTQKVMGTAENTFNKVEHNPPMLSLAKSMNFEELKKWLIYMKEKQIDEISVEGKLDGLACKLKYKNGKLIQAATRGDGRIGEDITQTALLIPSIPKNIDYESLGEDLEVRGEIFLTKSGLENINNSPNTTKKYKNVRNAASGILRNKTPDKEQTKYLKFGAYMLPDSDKLGFQNHMFAMDFLKELGFTPVNSLSTEFVFDTFKLTDENIVNIKNYIEELNDKRQNIDFDIDGIVFKANKISDQKRLGNKSTVPNWATAYKFPPMTGVTVLEEVEWLLGSKGNITPRAKIRKINICGADINYVTLHNIEEIKRLGIMINDHVTISRQGDVIPKIKSVLFNMRSGEETEVVIPKACPICNMPVSNDGIFIRCDNDNCQGRLAGRVKNLVTKLEIKDLGTGLIDKIVEANLISDQADIFTLKESDIANLERAGDKTAKKIIKNIKDAIKSPLSKVIAGLTLPGVGDNSGKNLSKKYVTLDKFANATYEEIIEIVDMGDVTTSNIIDWLNNEDNKLVLNKLISIGVGMTPESSPSGNKLEGKKFAFTGALSISRKEVEKIIENNGGEVYSIKKGLDILILGENGKQEKADKAKKYGAEVISEEDFFNMLK